MPIWTIFSKFLRRKVIFGLIFAFLLTYCVLSLFCNEKKEQTFGNDFNDIDNTITGGSDYLFNVEDGDYNKAKFADTPLLWQMKVLNDIGNDNSVELENVEILNDNETSSKPCRNSVQGKSLIVDEKGYVCARHNILANGCCNTEIFEQTENLSSSVPYLTKARYTCETCNNHGCCAIYEYCVSCCLDPKKIKLKKTSNTGQFEKQNMKLKKISDSLKVRLRSLDRFQMCLAACRTSSASVQHENTYKNPYSKHCFLLQLPSSRLSRRHKRNSLSLNNNNKNDLSITFISSSRV
ncbi:SREBP regulating gene protein [Phymastichus coffea]|uniref:SREBP regulating gene protein n=1 Tax=Phymastichus coffea TaxID=108790 RepID=UPI00273A774A|nr:SREBP regulating gene protein [Phymastichus coffea]